MAKTTSMMCAIMTVTNVARILFSFSITKRMGQNLQHIGRPSLEGRGYPCGCQRLNSPQKTNRRSLPHHQPDAAIFAWRRKHAHLQNNCQKAHFVRCGMNGISEKSSLSFVRFVVQYTHGTELSKNCYNCVYGQFSFCVLPTLSKKGV